MQGYLLIFAFKDSLGKALTSRVSPRALHKHAQAHRKADLHLRFGELGENILRTEGCVCDRTYLRNLGTTPILKKRSRSEKAILGATLGILGHSRSNSPNGTHDLIYVKTLFSEQLSERLRNWLISAQILGAFFFKIGVVPAPDYQSEPILYTEQMDAEGLGRKLLLTPTADPRQFLKSRLWVL